MRTAKQSIKSKKQTKAVIAQSLQGKGKKVKVVEIKLATKQKKDKLLADRKTKDNKSKVVTAKSKAVKAEKSQKVEKTAKVKAAPKKTVAKVEVTPQKKERIETEVTQPQGYPAASLSSTVLRPFREIARLNRNIIREKQRRTSRAVGFLAKHPKKGRSYQIDLRVHSPGSIGYLAPGGVDPAVALVRLAKAKGIAVLGLTDFFNASYVDKIKALANDAALTVIPGLDLCCQVGMCNDIVITALFPEATTGADLFSILEELGVPKSVYGFSGYCVKRDFSEVLATIEARGGLVIPSGVDKTPYRHLAIPTLVEQFGFHCFDLIHPENPEFFRKHWPSGGFTFFSFSSANSLGQIGSRAAKIRLETPNFENLKEIIKRRENTVLSS